MHYDYSIVGGGLGGILCAGWLKVFKPDAKVALFEPSTLGNSLATGGFKHLRSNPKMLEVFDSLGIKYHLVPIVGAMLDADERWIKFPDCVKDIENIQKIHYLKTRGTMEGFSNKVMNWGGKPVSRVVVDTGELIIKMLDGVDIYEEHVTKLHSASDSHTFMRSATTSKMLEFHNLIWTPHIMFLSQAIGANLTWEDCKAAKLNIIRCQIHPEMIAAQSDGNDGWEYWSWDYMYTPHLKGVHRISVCDYSPHAYQAEWNDHGNHSEDSIIYELYKQGFIVDKFDTVSTINGHLLPLTKRGMELTETLWRAGICLMGRFAQWNHRMTIDQNANRMEATYGK